MELWQTLITAAVSAGLTGIIVHLLTARRDARNRQREERISYRIGAYRALAGSVNRREPSAEHQRAIENAVDDILLFGTQQEVDAVQLFMRQFASDGDASLDEVLDILRTNLRAELKEKPAPLAARIRSLRIDG